VSAKETAQFPIKRQTMLRAARAAIVLSILSPMTKAYFHRIDDRESVSSTLQRREENKRDALP